eukprot:1143267-Pelagomonas_calceolata.AAC.5
MMTIRGPQVTLLASDHPEQTHSSTLGPIFFSQKYVFVTPIYYANMHSNNGKKEVEIWPGSRRGYFSMFLQVAVFELSCCRKVPEGPKLENSQVGETYAGSMQTTPVFRPQI